MKNVININLTKPSFDQNELKAAKAVLQSGWLIRGKQTQLFEEEFAKFMGAKYAVATNGCSMALYLVLKELKLKKADEVIVPSLTWNATAAAVIFAGATPVFADVKLDDWCLDPKDVLKKITKKTKLVIPVHFAGRYAQGFDKFPIPILFDSAHRIEKNGFDKITSCYSFYAVKNMTTVRGGMVLTSDKKVADWCKMGVHGGLAQDTLARYQGSGKSTAAGFYYEVEIPMLNFDMTDVEAAIGREQLKKVSKLNKRRDAIVAKYNRSFGLNNGGNHLYPILVDNRDKFLTCMKDAGIRCAIHYLPLHTMKGYKNFNKHKLPNTEFISKRCVSIPLYPDLSATQVDYIIKNTKKFAEFTKV